MQYVVLTVVAIAAILITVDTVRHRADLRRRPNVYRAVTRVSGAVGYGQRPESRTGPKRWDDEDY